MQIEIFNRMSIISISDKDLHFSLILLYETALPRQILYSHLGNVKLVLRFWV